MSGSADGVVQAGQVSGGVHFHGHGGDQSAGTARGERKTAPTAGGRTGIRQPTEELERLDAVLPGDGGEPLVVSVYVIAGTAGAGKTSLALRWAHQVRECFPDGQLYVNLRGYDPGEPVAAQRGAAPPPHRARVPAESSAGPGAAAALYRSMLADRRMLIVLDNAATVGQVRPLLPGTARSLVMVTSRSRLSGLAVRDGAHRLTLGMLPSRRRSPCCAPSPPDTARGRRTASSPNWPGCAPGCRWPCGSPRNGPPATPTTAWTT